MVDTMGETNCRERRMARELQRNMYVCSHVESWSQNCVELFFSGIIKEIRRQIKLLGLFFLAWHISFSLCLSRKTRSWSRNLLRLFSKRLQIVNKDLLL